MGGNGLSKKPDFPNEMVSGCCQLPGLDLSDKHFIDSQKAFALNLDNLYNFKILNLSENHFTILEKEMMNAIDQVSEWSSGLLVNLHGNQLVCNCDLLPFNIWATDHMANWKGNVKIHKYMHYKCIRINSKVSNLDTVISQEVTKYHTKCHPPKQFSDIMTVGETLAYLLLILHFFLWIIAYQILCYQDIKGETEINKAFVDALSKSKKDFLLISDAELDRLKLLLINLRSNYIKKRRSERRFQYQL